MNTTTNRIPKDDIERVATCLAFITGVLDADLFNDVDGSGQPTHKHHYCVPDDATGTQFAKVVVKYGKDHPEELNDPAVSLIIMAMRWAFPCG